jgi:thiol-disulfide isomerase/thioredoxin
VAGLLAVTALLAVAIIVGLLMQLRNGRFRHAVAPPSPQPQPLDPVLATLGVTAGTPVTLLQFSSAFCAPCRTTRILCADAERRWPGLRHVEVDAEAHLDAVRALEIWRTPTVLLIAADGQIAQRASGAPARAQLDAAIAATLRRSDVGTAAATG